MKYVKLIIKIIIISSLTFLYKIKTLNDNYYYVCLGNIDQAVIKCVLWMMLLLGAVSFIGSGNIKFWRIRISIVLPVLIYGLCHCTSATTLVFESPNNTNTLVIREKYDPIRYYFFSSFGSYSTSIYCRKETIMTNKQFHTAAYPSDGAFKDGRYSVKWMTEDTVHVAFNSYEVTLDMNDMERSYGGFTTYNGVRKSLLGESEE